MASERHRWVIDSIEEFVATVEVDGKRMIQVPQSVLPAGAKEGDVLAVTNDVAEPGKEPRLSIVVDRDATRAAMEKSARQVTDRGRSPNDPGGDIKL